MKINAVILAGGRAGDKLGGYTGENNEALINIGSFPMIDYIVKAFANFDYAEKIALVGPKGELEARYGNQKRIILAPPGETAAGSVVNGLKVLGDSRYVLIASSDIPLIDAMILKKFVDSCFEMGEADLYYPIIERSINEGKYPGAERTYVHLKEGEFTGGNIVLLKPEIVEPRVGLAEQLIDLRKKPLSLCRFIGMGFVLKYLCGRLTVEEAAERFSRLLDIKALAVNCMYPEIGMDVDKPSDLELVEQVLASTS